MYNSLIFQILTILHVTMCTMSQSLIQQIYNTQQLIALYQQKLEILLQMHESQNQNKSISQNRTVNQAKTSKHSTIFKLQQQIIFESNIQLEANSQYVGPNYLINGTQIMDITQNTRRFRFVGHLIGFQPVQITTRISDDQIAIYKLGGEDLVENRFKLKVRNQGGKWHHATQFQDIFLQYQLDTLTLTSQKQTKIYKFKSEIIKLFSINQYKILFVTRYSYGYLNPKSFEVTSQTQFDSIAQSCYYSSIQATLLILFNDRNLMVIVHGNVVSKQSMPGDIIITKNTQMDYLGSNYLFVYENGFKCFNIFEISTPSYLLTHNRQICPSQKFLSQKQKQPESMFFKYKFFKNRDNYKFLLTDNITETKLYVLNLKQKQLVSQRTFPWKITLIIFCIVAVVYFRSSKSNSNKKIDPDEKMRAYKKLRREKLVNSQVGNSKQSQAQNQDPQNQQQYIQSLNSELRRMKNAKQGKKTN